MSRKKSQPKKNIIPDPKFNSTIIPKLINNIMYDGKRGIAAKIVYDAIEKIKSKTKLLAVTKANGYGSDSIEISKFLDNKVDYFAVAYSSEGKLFSKLFLHLFHICKTFLLKRYFLNVITFI